jgi:hypothetical protein
MRECVRCVRECVVFVMRRTYMRECVRCVRECVRRAVRECAVLICARKIKRLVYTDVVFRLMLLVALVVIARYNIGARLRMYNREALR